jgi:flagellar basal-body rod protein FlgF
MDRVLYVAMSGARQTMQAQAANAHNLANASTTGFREDLLAFSAQELTGPGHASRIYSRLDGSGVNLAPGTQINTGRPLDVAVAGSGWIAVQAPDGGEAYTRAGDLQITATGMLVTGAGYPVLGETGAPIVLPPAERVDIASDGTISIRPLGQTPEALAVIDRIRLVDPAAETLVKGRDGLMRSENGAVAAPDAAVRLNIGVLEGSNVNTVDAMVNMISLSRQFEMQVKMMQTAEENDRASAQMMQIG